MERERSESIERLEQELESKQKTIDEERAQAEASIERLEKEKCEGVEANKQHFEKEVARLRGENESSVSQLTSALDEEKTKSLSHFSFSKRSMLASA